ncbi:MAG: crossover junction endodeoxyribonuclease RuvC [Alphaproteobacteria bacterium]|nr:crossover junction endodeoxyribonuclease RuvC [Alphaproteobacteria bacterium]
MRIIGIDPGLRHTGWGVIESNGSRLLFIAAGVVSVEPSSELAPRLASLFRALETVVEQYKPDLAAVEETFVNSNARSSLTLGQARAVALLVPALRGITVGEYAANLVKKSVVGNGHATKDQIKLMIGQLLPRSGEQGSDSADALAVALCAANRVRLIP